MQVNCRDDWTKQHAHSTGDKVGARGQTSGWSGVLPWSFQEGQKKRKKRKDKVASINGKASGAESQSPRVVALLSPEGDD